MVASPGSAVESSLRSRDESDARGLRIELLGTFRVSVGENIIDDSQWYLRKAKSLIKLLALSDSRRLHRGEIMDRLWPSLDAGAAGNNLHKVLYVARRVLEPDLPPKAPSRYLQLSGELVVLDVAHVWIDVVEFRAAAERALAARDVTVVREALDLYAGELLPEDRYEEWTIRPRDELRQLQIALLFELAELHTGRGEGEEAIDVLRQVIALDEANEQAHVELMRHLASSGQRQAALRQYVVLRNALDREMGVEPDAVAQGLYSEILSGHYVPDQSVETTSIEVVGIGPSDGLVGRDGVLEHLRGRVAALSEGHGSLILLHGDAGVGKSTLADRINQEAAQRGAISLWGAAYRDEPNLPYGALRLLLEGFAVRVGAPRLRALSDGIAAELACLAPAFSRVLDADERHQLPVAMDDEVRMTAALIQFFSALSNHVPLVVIVEDVHWADASTVRFLDRVSHLISELPILFVCTCRSEGISVGSELGRLLSGGVTNPGMECVEVQPLSDVEVGTMAERLLGTPLADDVLGVISTVARGVPYYVEETISALRGRRRIQQLNGVWTIRKGIRVVWSRDDVRRLVDAEGDFQLVRKLRAL